jgi:hypothetical protein
MNCFSNSGKDLNAASIFSFFNQKSQKTLDKAANQFAHCSSSLILEKEKLFFILSFFII